MGLALGWAVLVVGALVATLESLRTDDFDGLNNMLQIPLALPWFFVVPSVGSHVGDAWIVAGLGMVNAVLLFLLVSKAQERRLEGS
jgi:hypothetical protein